MRAEVLPGGNPATLTVSFDVDDLGVVSDGSPLADKLAAHAGGFADAVLEATGAAPEPGSPRQVDAVVVRLTKTVIVADATVPLAAPAEVWGFSGRAVRARSRGRLR